MKKTSLGLKKPEGTDLVNIQDMNDNMDVIEKELQARVKTTGDIKDTTVTFTQASSRANIVTGEKMAVIMGKIKKFFADLTAPAFAQMITTKADLMATKATGYVPDAKAVADAVSEVNSKLTWTVICTGVTLRDGYKWFNMDDYNEIYVVIQDDNNVYHPFIIPRNQIIDDPREFGDNVARFRCINGAIAIICNGGMSILCR